MSEGCCTHEEMPFQGSRQSEQPPNQGLKPFPGLHKGSLPKPPAPRRLKDFTSMAPFRKGGAVVSLRHSFEMSDLGFSLQAGGQFIH